MRIFPTGAPLVRRPTTTTLLLGMKSWKVPVSSMYPWS
jgi:hypothetical protein